MFKFKNKETGETKTLVVKPKDRNVMFWSKWELVEEKEADDKRENKQMKNIKKK